MFVYILNCHGVPLMPCSPRKARLLLKQAKAKVVKMVPFTLQLLYGSSGYTQEVALGVDAGTQHIGISATTEQKVLFEAEVRPRNDIQEVLATRSQFRRARRNRKTRYRACRFLNRKKPKGWLALQLLPHAKTFYQVTPITPPHNTALESLDKGQRLILDQTDQPLAQVLRYLNRHKDTAWYRMNVERRAIMSSSRYGDNAEFVAMAGSWPGEIQWCYQGAAWSYELWSTHEQVPLEEMLHKYLTNQHRVYWVFEKRPENMTKYRYYARIHTWQTGWHGADTPEQLVAILEQKEFLRK